jgi:hypothetical protein
MIKNDHELAVTLLWIKRFKRSAEHLKSNPENLEPLLSKLQVDTALSMVEDLKNQVREYRKNG